MVKKNATKGYKFVFDSLKVNGFEFPLYGYSEFYRGHNGQRGVNNYGYLTIDVDGERVAEHRHRAEKALGRPIPEGVIVHHHNANQLIICENQKYHTLIHKRMRNSGYDKKFWTNRISELGL
jgi:hypothetical protein